MEVDCYCNRQKAVARDRRQVARNRRRQVATAPVWFLCKRRVDQVRQRGPWLHCQIQSRNLCRNVSLQAKTDESFLIFVIPFAFFLRLHYNAVIGLTIKHLYSATRSNIKHIRVSLCASLYIVVNGIIGSGVNLI